VWLSICAVLCVLVVLLIPLFRQVMALREYYASVKSAKAKVESLQERRPADVPDEQWQRAVEWTSNVIGQIYFSPECGDLASLKRLDELLDEKLDGQVDLGTLRWV